MNFGGIKTSVGRTDVALLDVSGIGFPCSVKTHWDLDGDGTGSIGASGKTDIFTMQFFQPTSRGDLSHWLLPSLSLECFKVFNIVLFDFLRYFILLSMPIYSSDISTTDLSLVDRGATDFEY